MKKTPTKKEQKWLDEFGLTSEHLWMLKDPERNDFRNFNNYFENQKNNGWCCLLNMDHIKDRFNFIMS